jgi:Tol biopolymer transport system component
MRVASKVVLSLLVGSGCLTAGLAAQETASDTLLTVQHYLDFERVGDPQISPDGSQIVYTRGWVNKLEDTFESSLWLMNVDGTKQRFLIEGGSPRWSPDGTRIAYIAAADGKPQIFVRWMDAEGAASQVTRLTDGPGSLQWSPDGKWLSFTMGVKYDNTWKISMPAPPEGAKWTPAPRRVTDMHYRMDRAGFMELAHTHLFVVPADGGTPRQVTKGEFDLGAQFDRLGFGVGYDWTPDSKSLVFDGYLGPKADFNYRNSDIHIADVATGTMRKLTPRAGAWTNPAVSPDGKMIAFAGYDSTRKSYSGPNLVVRESRFDRSPPKCPGLGPHAARPRVRFHRAGAPRFDCRSRTSCDRRSPP